MRTRGLGNHMNNRSLNPTLSPSSPSSSPSYSSLFSSSSSSSSPPPEPLSSSPRIYRPNCCSSTSEEPSNSNWALGHCQTAMDLTLNLHSNRKFKIDSDFIRRFKDVVVLLLLLNMAASGLCDNNVPSNQQVHKRMTREQLQQIFHVDTHEKVPEYEVVHVRSLRKRNADEDEETDNQKHVHVSAFGKQYQLRLSKNPYLMKKAGKHLKVLMADVKDGTLRLEEVQTQGRNWTEIGEPYQDVVNQAAVLVHHEGSTGIRLDGTIGKHLVIKPMPPGVKKELTRIMESTADDEMFLDEEYLYSSDTSGGDQMATTATTLTTSATTNSSTSTTSRQPPLTNSTKELFKSNGFKSGYDSNNGMHFVYKMNQPELEGGSDYLFMEPDKLPSTIRSTRSHHKREAPNTIWPEVLVIADYDTYAMHGSNSVNIKRYFVSFWNGVDLRYKLLSSPRVRISLAGIIISKGRDATPYLENNRVQGDAVDSAAALTDMGKYLFRERRLPTYDLAVVVTKLDLCRRQFQTTHCNTGTAGFAYVGGACVVNSRLEKVNSVAIVEDTGGFSGIIVAAHEVGHLLGAVHDGSPAPNYLGGPGAEHCRWEDGYIMSDLRHTERGFQWSTCSLEQFRHFLNSDTATCLHNVPHEDEELPRILPGKLLSLDAQCRKDRGTSACFKDDRVCAQLFCFDSKSGYCVSYRPAAEGSPCGDGQYCMSGRCILEHDNYIPDFTRISETVVDSPTILKAQRTTDSFNEKSTTSSSGLARSKFRYSTLIRKTNPTTDSLNSVDDDVTSRPASPDNAGNVCEDVMEKLAGDLTCEEFLNEYGRRYCSHPYIILNCCASRHLVCRSTDDDNQS